MATDRLAGSREIGYLGESGALYPDMTPVSYLRFAATAEDGFFRDRASLRTGGSTLPTQ